MGSEGEHLDSVRILAIKNQGCTMRNFYGVFQPFQIHNQNNQQITSITSAGPVWQIQCKSPMATQAVRDATWNYCQQNNIEATVIKGKSNITTSKERIVVGISDSIAKIFRIEKPKGKGKGQNRIITGWPDQNNQFSLIADSFNMVAGRINFEKMEYEIFISKKAASSEQVAQQLAHQIRAFDSSDRVGFLLPISIELVADLDNNDWGRRPRGQQGAVMGTAPGPLGQPIIGQQQQQLGQPGTMAPHPGNVGQQQQRGQHGDPWHAAAFGTMAPAPSFAGTPCTYAYTPTTAVGSHSQSAVGSHSQPVGNQSQPSQSSGSGSGNGAPIIGAGEQPSLATGLGLGNGGPL